MCNEEPCILLVTAFNFRKTGLLDIIEGEIIAATHLAVLTILDSELRTDRVTDEQAGKNIHEKSMKRLILFLLNITQLFYNSPYSCKIAS